VTHTGVCGACSTRQDLAVYMKYFDMTAPGKKCGIRGLLGLNRSIKCFEGIGMSKSCANIWAYNARHDSKNCRYLCFRHYFSKYNGPFPTCALNDCLECDEQKAGPKF